MADKKSNAESDAWLAKNGAYQDALRDAYLAAKGGAANREELADRVDRLAPGRPPVRKMDTDG
jgi:hypothetical protein